MTRIMSTDEITRENVGTVVPVGNSLIVAIEIPEAPKVELLTGSQARFEGRELVGEIVALGTVRSLGLRVGDVVTFRGGAQLEFLNEGRGLATVREPELRLILSRGPEVSEDE